MRSVLSKILTIILLFNLLSPEFILFASTPESSQVKDDDIKEIVMGEESPENHGVHKEEDLFEDYDNEKTEEMLVEDQEFESEDKELSIDEELESEIPKSNIISATSLYQESKTSRLGHLKNANVKIYKDIEDLSAYVTAGAEYTHAVYYIKLQADYDGDRYYLISTEPSATTGVVGWVKSTDLSIHTHVGIDKDSKTFYIKGSGSAYEKAWGGKKDLVFGDMSKFINEVFSVHLTERVGNNVWYRGRLDGKVVWLHSSYVSESPIKPQEAQTSKLGHLKNSNVRIYSDLSNLSNYRIAGSNYTHAVYYIKRQANHNGQRYYLISTSPSATKGVVGWVSTTDLSTHTHLGVDKESKTFYIKGTGNAYSKAWGGKKDLVFGNMLKYKDQVFAVHLTERVGNNIWYRGRLDGEIVWLHSSYVENTPSTPQESKTSKLGHLKNKNVRIYSDLENLSDYRTAGSAYTHAVYYIKRQADYKDSRYYLLSTSPSATTSVVGWVKSTDLSTHTHVGVDKNSKTLYIKGSGSAYSKAWGGKKDIIFEEMSEYKNHNFDIHLTERVGNNIWYRGQLEGKTVWIHSDYLEESRPTLKESSTSMLGHIRNSNVRIYSSLRKMSNYKIAGSNYTNAVYYIKKQAELNSDLYYLISLEPSSVNGVVGWVKATDLSTHTHVGVDKDTKIFYFTGKGTAYSKAWGGKKDIEYSNMAPHADKAFKVHLTERVGNNIWYRGSFNGKTIWLHSSYVSDSITKQTYYNRTLKEMIDLQMGFSPQTDKYSKDPAYVHSSLIDRNGSSGEINTSSVRVRSKPNTTSHIFGSLARGRKVSILGETTGTVVSNSNVWYQISYSGWRLPTRSDLTQYVDPNLQDPLQFLILSKPAGITQSVLNIELSGRGVLHNKGDKFLEASRKYSINEAYLVSHSLLETGNGSSSLARGIEVGKNTSGESVLVTSSNRKNLSKIKTVYNMYGIGAYDSDPVRFGAIRAYDEGWVSVDLAIVEGAQFVSSSYFNRGQDTLYKMRWNPETPSGHRYATDIGWAAKQVSSLNRIYERMDNPSMAFDIPVYK